MDQEDEKAMRCANCGEELDGYEELKRHNCKKVRR